MVNPGSCVEFRELQSRDIRGGRGLASWDPRPPGSGGKGSRPVGPTTPSGQPLAGDTGPPRCLHKPVSKTRRGLRWDSRPGSCASRHSHQPRSTDHAAPRLPTPATWTRASHHPGSTQPHCRASAQLPTWTDPHRKVTESDACGGPATLSLDSPLWTGVHLLHHLGCAHVSAHTHISVCAHACLHMHTCAQACPSRRVALVLVSSAVLSWPAQVSRWRTTHVLPGTKGWGTSW